MNKQKLLLFVLICLSVAFCSFCYAFAHPGRTDENGGHWDRSAGTYHYHNGEYAGRSHAYSPSARAYEPFTPPYTPAPRKVDVVELVMDIVFVYTPLCLLGIFLLYVFMIKTVLPSIHRRFPKYKIHQYGVAIVNFYHNENEIKKLQNQIKKSLADFPVPNDVEIGPDGLPKEKRSNGWGEKFTYYRTRSGKKIHKTYLCNHATIPCHIFTYAIYQYHTSPYNIFCSKCCKDSGPTFYWYIEYKKRLQLQKDLENLESKIKTLLNDVKRHNDICNSDKVTKSIFFSKYNEIHLKSFNKDYEDILSCVTKKRIEQI